MIRRTSATDTSMKPATYKPVADRGVVPASVPNLVHRLRHGDTRALARAITLIENDAPEAPAILSSCFPHTGHALSIGITGAPGAGKSTLVDRLSGLFRESGKTVGIVAVDPTSPFTGGAILGDRIRFQERAGRVSDPGLYVRSMATRGALGGLALATADVALVVEASGKDIVLIETVGVGQDEIDIARLADITVLVLVPGMGDDVQSLKAGVMEIADLYIVNKSDREGTDRLEQEIRALQSLTPRHSSRHASRHATGIRSGAVSEHLSERAEKGPLDEAAFAPQSIWTPPILRTVATTGEGMDLLAAALHKFEGWLREDDRLAHRRSQHWQRRLEAMLRTEFSRRALGNGLTAVQLREFGDRIASRQEDPWSMVAQLAARLFGTPPVSES